MFPTWLARHALTVSLNDTSEKLPSLPNEICRAAQHHDNTGAEQDTSACGTDTAELQQTAHATTSKCNLQCMTPPGQVRIDPHASKCRHILVALILNHNREDGTTPSPTCPRPFSRPSALRPPPPRLPGGGQLCWPLFVLYADCSVRCLFPNLPPSGEQAHSVWPVSAHRCSRVTLAGCCPKHQCPS
jgi:hypothetical protein